MRRRVIATNCATARYINHGAHSVTNAERPFLRETVMCDETGMWSTRVNDREDARFGAQYAGIADLTAGLRVKRRAVQDDRHMFTCLRAVLRAIRTDDRDNRPVRFGRVITEELRGLETERPDRLHRRHRGRVEGCA